MARVGTGAITITDVSDGADGPPGASPSFERSYTTTAGLLTEIGDPTTPGTGVSWVSVSSPFTIPDTAFWAAERFTINSVVSAWQIFPVQAKDGGIPFVTYTITRTTPAVPTLNDTQWITDAIEAVEDFTGRDYSNQKEFGYGTVVVITYIISGVTTKLSGLFKRVSGVDTWVAPGTFIDGDLVVDGTIAADKIQTNSLTATQIKAGTVTSTEIKAGSIDADRLSFTAGGGGAEQWTQAKGTAGDYDTGTSVFNNGNFYVSTVDNNATEPPSSTWTAIVGGDSNSTLSRLTITSEKIEIYEGNTLRVVLGNLA